MKVGSTWILTPTIIASAVIDLMKSQGFSVDDFEKGKLPRSFWETIATSFGMTREKLNSFIRKNGDAIRARILDSPKEGTP